MPKRNAFRFGQSKAEAPPLWHFPSPVLAIRSIASFDSLTRFERATPIATRIYPSAVWQTCCAFTRQQRPSFKDGLCSMQTNAHLLFKLPLRLPPPERKPPNLEQILEVNQRQTRPDTVGAEGAEVFAVYLDVRAPLPPPRPAWRCGQAATAKRHQPPLPPRPARMSQIAHHKSKNGRLRRSDRPAL